MVSRTFHYESIILLFPSHFNVLSLFEQPISKIKYSIIKIRFKIICFFVICTENLSDLNTYREPQIRKFLMH